MAPKSTDTPGEDVVVKAKADRAERRGFFSGIVLFLKQVFAELKKVVTPTRKELLSYTAVVLVFVCIMMALVYGIDFVFAWVVTLVFGTAS
ncbi:preprotein translocase subunit SecE [Plantibacter sp. VKM Ac-2885]|uniref:Protein translocase subunit SecE n=3 Tax=Plantibacter TaxID=190323 RepID=A0A3N2C5T7_9MICO|nr:MULTISPECIES: preprotein translocase subunit SecE [Plantibacter]MBD8104201.1 preprotein translocase subunit SecE [Plantibacter sp. CFBP 8775]MBD8467640.1 preprotein translocase subunit SecE [Plantibacter sp. CFBP 8798]MBD8517629.1 preprotein translocase subunit SecE [Plantibacter sp. CFBP 8804]MBF4513813.1 preprotein translocase subunit SecE [Plantibacter sp. VKM Ac-2885]AZH81515.1 preprotein translocase subunit SecE [Plantibacter sp. PA-3-X8]